MRHIIGIIVVLVAFGFGWMLSAATAQEKKVFLVDSAKAEFKPMAPGASLAVIMGDPNQGRHAAFVKFDPGSVFDMHTHTNDIRIVVVKGSFTYKGKSGAEHKVGPGMFLSEPGGDHHWTGADAKDGCIFYMECEGKFDLIPDKK